LISGQRSSTFDRELHIGFGGGNLRKKRPLEKPGRKWKYHIITDLQEEGLESKDWIPEAKDKERWLALVNKVMNFRGSIKCGEFLELLTELLAS